MHHACRKEIYMKSNGLSVLDILDFLREIKSLKSNSDKREYSLKNEKFFLTQQCGKVVINTITVFTEKFPYFPSNQHFYCRSYFELVSRKFLSKLFYFSTVSHRENIS